MVPVSIVIITKSEADIMATCLEKARLITDDIVVIDSSTDRNTGNINGIFGYRIFKTAWDGYGINKNKGIHAAKYDWILSIDADEIPDDELIRALHDTDLSDPSTVFDIKFRSYFGEKQIHFGSWGRDHHIRLFNRRRVKWSEAMVHETLVIPEHTPIQKIEGYLHHYSVKDSEEYGEKCSYYARLSAKKYLRLGKKANAVKLYISPAFGFFKNYLIYLGFLDGRAGWDIAIITAKNTRLKYQYLSLLENAPTNAVNKHPVNESLVVEY